MRPERIQRAMRELNEKLTDILHDCQTLTELKEISVYDVRDIRTISRKILRAKGDLILLTETGGMKP